MLYEVITLATRYAGPLATGENLFSMQDARNLIRHGGLRADRDVPMPSRLKAREEMRQHRAIRR